MAPITFNRVNVIYGRNQKEYLPLPAYRNDSTGIVTSCWKAESFFERILFLWTGRIWVQQMCGAGGFHPQRITSEHPLDTKT